MQMRIEPYPLPQIQFRIYGLRKRTQVAYIIVHQLLFLTFEKVIIRLNSFEDQNEVSVEFVLSLLEGGSSVYAGRNLVS